MTTARITAADGTQYDLTYTLSPAKATMVVSRLEVVVPPPPPPALTAPKINFVRAVSTFNPLFNVTNNGMTTSNNLFVSGGSAYPGATVSVYLGSVLQGTTTADGSGNWTFGFGVLVDAVYAVKASVASGGQTSAFSSPLNFTIAPGLTSLPVAMGQNIITHNALNFDSENFNTNSTNQTAGHTNNQTCIPIDTHTLKFTVLSTDLYNDFGDNSNRSEIAMNGRYVDGTTFNMSYEVMFDAASPVNNSFGPGNFAVVGQMHDAGGGSPVFYFTLGGSADHTNMTGDKLTVEYYTGSQFLQAYAGPGNITRGVWYPVDIIVKPNPNGQGVLQVWWGGVQIVNMTSASVYGLAPYYFKLGMYRDVTQDQTQTYSYRNFICRRT